MAEQQISLIESLKPYQHDDEVEAFLRSHLILSPVLVVAYERAVKLFGEHLENITLKVVHDPEIPNFVHLVGYIYSRDSISDLRQKLDKLEDTWYLSLPFELRDIFYFTVRSKQ